MNATPICIGGAAHQEPRAPFDGVSERSERSIGLRWAESVGVRKADRESDGLYAQGGWIV